MSCFTKNWKKSNLPFYESIGIFHTEGLPKSHIYGDRPYHIPPDGLTCGFIVDDDAYALVQENYPFTIQRLPTVEKAAVVVFQGAYQDRGQGSLKLYEWAIRNNCTFDLSQSAKSIIV